MGKGMDGLTERQERFCQEYAKSGNATQSAIHAGYSERSAKQVGSRLMTNADVQDRIRELQGEIKNEKIAEAREIQEVLTSIIRGESEEEVIVVENCGDGCSEAIKKKKKPSHSDKIKASQLLAKMQGVLDNSLRVDVTIPVYGGEADLED